MSWGSRILFLSGSFLLFTSFVPEGRSAVLLDENFTGTGPGVVMGGEFVTLEDGARGWRARWGGNTTEGREYIEYDAAGIRLQGERGTIEFEVQRDELQPAESIVSLQGEHTQRLFGLRILWDGKRTDVDYPAFMVFAANPDNQWYTQGMRDSAHEVLETLPLGYEVRSGERLRGALVWDDVHGCRLWVGGRRVGEESSLLEMLPREIPRAKKLMMGGERDKRLNPDGTFAMSHSPIRRFRISDVPHRVEDLWPEIQAVSHDAAKVAGYSGKLVGGETLTVTLEAEPGGKAVFDVGPIAGIAMSESADHPGTYLGTYVVREGDLVEKGKVVGRFVSSTGVEAAPGAVARTVDLDGRVHLAVSASNDLVPADKAARAGLTVVATDANGRKLRDRALKLTLSTTDEYTGMVGGGDFTDQVGGSLKVDWGGVTDSFGEVTAQYLSGFAAKTALISAKDMASGDVGVGWIRSYVVGRVEISVKDAAATRLLSLRGTLTVTASRTWLTADGSSRSRITAQVLDSAGKPVSGDQVSFTLVGDRGQVRVIQARTDGGGRAYADYIAGKTIGQVQIEVRDATSGLTAMVAIELRADAPAEVAMRAEPPEVFLGDVRGSSITAKVTDVNGNPNWDTEVAFAVASGEGTLSAPKGVTDREEGVTSVVFLPGRKAGTVTVRGTVTSRAPTAEELSAAEGAVFLHGLGEDPGRLEVAEWLVEPKAAVAAGQELVRLVGRRGAVYTVKAPREGVLSVRTAEEGDEVTAGDTLAYVLETAKN